MKKLLTLLALTVAALVMTPTQVEARGCGNSYTYISGYSSCGCPIYTKRVIAYYDCYDRPVYRYYRQGVKHRCHNHHRHYKKSHRYHHNHGYHKKRHHQKRRYYRNSCGSYRRSGVSFHGDHAHINLRF